MNIRLPLGYFCIWWFFIGAEFTAWIAGAHELFPFTVYPTMAMAMFAAGWLVYDGILYHRNQCRDMPQKDSELNNLHSASRRRS